jgi:hypothetical protein
MLRDTGDFEDLGIDDIKIEFKEREWQSLKGIYVAHDKDLWWAVENIIFACLFYKIQGLSHVGEWLLASQEGFCSVDVQV